MIKKSKGLILTVLIGIVANPILVSATNINLNQVNIILAEEKENKLKVKFNMLKKENSSHDLIDKLNTLIDEVENSKMIFAEKHILISEIQLYIDEIKKNIANNNIHKIDKILKEEIRIEIIDKKPYILFPEIDSKYKITCSIIDKDSKDNIGIYDIKDFSIKLPDLESKTRLEIAISLLNLETGKEETSLLIDRVFEDLEGPKLKYLYIQNGIVHLDYDDNYKLAEFPAMFKEDSNEEFVKIIDKKFKLQSPGKVQILIEDHFNNQSIYEFDIKTNTAPIFGSIPDKVLKNLLGDKFLMPNKGANLIIGEKDNELNIKQVFENLIKEYFKIDNIDKIEIYSEKNPIISLDSLGLKEIKLKDDKGLNLNIYLYVVDSIDSMSSKVKSIEKKIEEDQILVVKNKEVNLLDLINIELINKETDLSYIFVREDGSNLLHPINNPTKLSQNSNNEIEIIDILDKKVYPINIINNTRANETTSIHKDRAKFNSQGQIPRVEFKQYYLDVDKDHWASNAITRLTDSGVLRGYDNRKFLPNNNMTIKEFLVMFGRFINLQDPAILNPSIKNRSITFEDWGQEEANNVITRIKPEVMERMDISDFSRNIKREEVAFLIANTIILDKDTSLGANLNDIANSKYKTEIEQLYLNDISKGMPDGSFGPSRNIRRSELVELFNNMLKN